MLQVFGVFGGTLRRRVDKFWPEKDPPRQGPNSDVHNVLGVSLDLSEGIKGINVVSPWDEAPSVCQVLGGLPRVIRGG